MSLLHCDSFDLMPERPTTDVPELAGIGLWTGVTFGIQGPFIGTSINHSRFTRGKGILLSSATLKAVTLPAAGGRDTYFWAGSTRSFDTFAASTAQWFSVFFYQGGDTVQVEVRWCQDGAIRVYRGSGGTNLIATFAGATASKTWEHWQVKLVVATGTGGSIRIRKNGDTVDTFSATGLNTRATSTSTCDGVALSGSQTVISGTIGVCPQVDDHIFWDDNPSSEPNNWIGDIRSYPLYATAAGSSTGFTPYAAPVVRNSSASASSYATGTTRLVQFTGDFDGVLNSVGLTLSTSLTGNLNVALYSDNGANRPDSLIATATAVTNPPTGLNVITFSSPPTVTRNTKYWVAFAADASVSLFNTGSTGVSFSAAYGSAFPSTPGTLTTGVSCVVTLQLIYTPTNYGAINEVSLDQDSSYIYSSVVGTEDYYQYDDLPYTPSNVLMLVVNSVARKSDTNPRSVRNQLKSGASTSLGSTYVLSSTYRTIQTPLFVDPATGLPWTKSAIDGIQAGTYIVA